MPPRLVFASKEMVMVDPSSENTADCRRGVGGSCLLLSTRMLSIEADADDDDDDDADSDAADGYCTTYSRAEGPDSTTRYE